MAESAKIQNIILVEIIYTMYYVVDSFEFDNLRDLSNFYLFFRGFLEIIGGAIAPLAPPVAPALDVIYLHS